MIKKLKAKYPDEVEIRHENKDGSIMAFMPLKWMRIKPPRVLSDEQKKIASERMKRLRDQKTQSTQEDHDPNLNETPSDI